MFCIRVSSTRVIIGGSLVCCYKNPGIFNERFENPSLNNIILRFRRLKFDYTFFASLLERVDFIFTRKLGVDSTGSPRTRTRKKKKKSTASKTRFRCAAQGRDIAGTRDFHTGKQQCRQLMGVFLKLT